MITTVRVVASDVRFALRLVARAPVFFAAVLAILAGGIGAATAMFALVRTQLLQPLPYPRPDELAMIWATRPGEAQLKISLPDFFDWKAGSSAFQRMAVVRDWGFSLTTPGKRSDAVLGAHVTGDFFPLLEVAPERGRLLSPEDDRVGGPRVTVLSAAFWRSRFGADPAIVGKTIDLEGLPYTIVGVAPDTVRWSPAAGSPFELWLPMSATYPKFVDTLASARDAHESWAVGRLRPGSTVAEAQAQLGAVAARVDAEHPGRRIGVRVTDLHEQVVGASRAAVWTLFAAVVLLFLLGCANVASLLFIHGESRRAEFAARAALGATSALLAAQVVTETVVLFAIAAPAGALLAHLLVPFLRPFTLIQGAQAAIDLRPIHEGIDLRALAFCVAVSLGCGALFGAVPAMAVARLPPQAALKQSGGAAPAGRWQRRAREALVVVQVAIAVVLLGGCGLAFRWVFRTLAIPAGFDPHGLTIVHVAHIADRCTNLDPPAIWAPYARVIAALAARADVEAVAANTAVPLLHANFGAYLDIEGRPEITLEKPQVDRDVVSPGYFRAMRIPILRGRDFSDDDRREGRPLVIISESVARAFFPGEDPVGKRLRHRDDLTAATPGLAEVIGVVGDVRRRALTEPPSLETYTPFWQDPLCFTYLVVRWRTPPVAIDSHAPLGEVPRWLENEAPALGVFGVLRMVDVLGWSIRDHAFSAVLLGQFAAIALGLTTVGIYSLLTYAAQRRAREIGVRVALGAPPVAIAWLVVRGGLRLLLPGIALGLLGLRAAGNAIASAIPGANGFDLGVTLSVFLVLVVASLLAGLGPAWRALRVPPAVALRHE